MAFTHKFFSRLKQAFLDFCGKLLLVTSLLVFGLPVMLNKYKQILLPAVCTMLALMVIACSGYAVFNFHSSIEDGETEQPTQTAVKPDPAQTAPKPDPIKLLKPNRPPAVFPAGMLEKYENLYALNSEVVGWLRVPHTAIDTVVTQRGNNSYYLNHDFYGNYAETGNLFLDYRDKTKEFSQNTVIYGHATVGLSPATSARYPYPVFSELAKYQDYRFYLKNPVIEYGTLYADYEWKVFAVFLSSTKSADDNGYYFYYIVPSIKESTFGGYLDQIKQRSYYFTGVDVNSSDKILTLSACSHENDVSGYRIDSRLVLVARLLRKGENKEIDASKVKDNPNFRRPQAWYDYYGLTNPYANSAKWSHKN